MPKTEINNAISVECIAEQEFEKRNSEILQTLHKMNNMTGSECVQFYVSNRTQMDYLDSLFEEHVVPKLLCGSYYDVREVRSELAQTPASEYFNEQYQVLRNDLLMEIGNEIDERGEIQKEAFVNEIVPVLEIEIDSLFMNDFKNVLDDYSGGFMNYKKLAFLLGRDSDTFVEKWNEMVNNKKYNAKNVDYLNMFIRNVDEWNEKYYWDVINMPYNHSINFKMPTYRFNLSKSVMNYVDEYTRDERKSMVVSGIKDILIPVALGAISCGTLTFIYEVANLGYDAAMIYDEIKNAKLGPEEMLEYRTENILNNSYRDQYLSQCIEAVFDLIDSESNYLYNRIENEL